MKYRLRGSNNSNLIERIFENRNIKSYEKDEFLNPSEYSVKFAHCYKNMQEGVDKMAKHMIARNDILVLVDSDTDGMCSSAEYIGYFKNDVGYSNIRYLLHKDKGHGLTEDIMKEIIKNPPNLLIIPDAGSSDYKEHAFLKNIGVDIIVIDHHECEGYSESALVINNQLDEIGNKTLSGGGMVLKFLELFDFTHDFDFAKKYYDLASVAMVADSMLMTEPETRYYVMEGLKNINNPLLEVLTENIAREDLTFETISFGIAPSINSIIRVGSEKDRADLFDAMICVDRTETIKLRGKGDVELPLEEYVVKIASRLKARQTKLIKSVLEDEETIIIHENLPIAVLIHNSDDAQALSGLIATRVVDAYNKPALVLREYDGYYKGSARSTRTYSTFRDYIIGTRMFEYALGHQSAFGVSVKISDFSNFLSSVINTTLESDNDCFIVDKAYIDGRLPAYDVLSVDELKNYWCKGFEKPLFYIRLKDLDSSQVTIMGKTGNTVKITQDYISYIKFKCSPEEVEGFTCSEKFDIEIIGTFNVNEWNGNSYPQVFIENYKITEIEEETIRMEFEDFNAFYGFKGA